MSRCPRCPAPNEALSRWRAASPSGEVELRGCDTCGGVFIERANLAAVCPTAAHLPDQAVEVELLTGVKGAGIGACPGCGSVPYQVTLVDVPVDFCTSCHGVWLDAADYQEAAFSDKRGAPAQAPYRAHAAELAADGRLEACAYCSGKFSPSELAFWEHGRICPACMAARNIQRAARAARASQSWLDDFFAALMR